MGVTPAAKKGRKALSDAEIKDQYKKDESGFKLKCSFQQYKKAIGNDNLSWADYCKMKSEASVTYWKQKAENPNHGKRTRALAPEKIADAEKKLLEMREKQKALEARIAAAKSRKK